MAGNLMLRIKTKDGLKTVENLSSQSTFEDLKVAIAAQLNVSSTAVSILHGFPPKELSVPNSTEITMSELKISNGDCLVVNVNPSVIADNCVKSKEEPSHQNLDSKVTCRGILTRHTVPADNSCLFTSLDFVLNKGKQIDTSAAAPMRRVIADAVAANPDLYDEAFLEKSNAAYCEWIMNSDSWGGAIELAILSDHCSIEIDVVNAQTGRLDRFGESSNYDRRVFLLYDGIHYDPLVLESPDGRNITTIFSTDDDDLVSQALELGHEAKSCRQFTDVNTFRIRCLVCQIILTGQEQAVSHSRVTGHNSYGEV